jgi:outer membrane protein TolC
VLLDLVVLVEAIDVMSVHRLDASQARAAVCPRPCAAGRHLVHDQGALPAVGGRGGSACAPRRDRMTRARARWLTSVSLAAILAVPAGSMAQPTAADPMAPRTPLAAPKTLPFRTPEAIAQREITVDEAIAFALENQPRIAQALQNWLAANERTWQALSPLLPQLSALGRLSYSGERSRLATDSTGSSISRTRTSVGSASITASQLIFDFGKTWAGRDAAKADAEFLREQVELQKDLIVLAVKESYLNQLLAARLVVVNAQALERAELNLRSAKGFFEVGTRPKSDVTRAEVDVANARVDLIRAQNAVSLARIALNTAMGVAIDSPTRLVDILGYQKFEVDRDTLVAESLRRRPEYRQSRFQVDAAEARVRQAFRNFWPDLVGVGTYGTTDSRINTLNNGVVNSDGPEWTLAAVANVRATELQVWQEVEQAHVSLIESEQRIFAAQKAVESAQENFRLAQGRFDAGVGTIIDLTDAQLALTQAQARRSPTTAWPSPGSSAPSAVASGRVVNTRRPERVGQP